MTTRISLAVLIAASGALLTVSGAGAQELRLDGPLFAQADAPAIVDGGGEGAAEHAGGDDERTGFMGLVEEEFYVGGRGLITAQGMSGMFLNPTSGTLGKGQFTVQWCVLLQDNHSGRPDVFGNGIMGSYGVTDWLEVGGFGLHATVDPSPFKTSGDDETLSVGGPFFRVRVLKEQDWMPEVSVGGLYLDGDSSSDAIARQEFVLAASKFFAIDEEGFIKGVRLHSGLRQVWRTERPGGEANGTVGYFGLEVPIPYDLFFVSEVSNKDDVLGPHVPYSFGMQWRPNNVVGISVAGVQPGGADRIALYVGLGLNFEF